MGRQTQKDMFQMFLEEHLDMIIGKIGRTEDAENIDQIEEIIAGLEPEKEGVMKDFMNRGCDREAEIARKAYVGGLLDGVKIAGVIWLEALRGQYEWDEVTE